MLQDPAHQIGQVQSRPINEWLTYHDIPDADGPRRADLKDFVETDTAYAVVVQAINDDGPGPYSNQYTIRTMSRGVFHWKRVLLVVHKGLLLCVFKHEKAHQRTCE